MLKKKAASSAKGLKERTVAIPGDMDCTEPLNLPKEEKLPHVYGFCPRYMLRMKRTRKEIGLLVKFVKENFRKISWYKFKDYTAKGQESRTFLLAFIKRKGQVRESPEIPGITTSVSFAELSSGVYCATSTSALYLFFRTHIAYNKFVQRNKLKVSKYPFENYQDDLPDDAVTIEGILLRTHKIRKRLDTVIRKPIES